MNEIRDARDEELMKRARKIVQKKHDLFINIICYAAANIIIIFVWLMTGAGFFWPIWCLLGWGFGLVVMALDVFRFINYKDHSDRVEQEYQKLKRYSDNQQ